MMPACPVAVIAPQAETTQVDRDLRVTALKTTVEEGTWTFTGQVRATYGYEVLTADRLVLHTSQSERFGEATGDVVVTDPDGTISATSFSFSWNPANQWGKAQDVTVHAGPLMFSAASADVTPSLWRFLLVRGTTCGDEKTPIYEVAASSAEIKPGVSGTLRGVRFYALGHHFLSLPRHTFSMTSKPPVGLQMPQLSYRRSAGLGIRWRSTFELNSSTSLNANFASFPKRFPSYQLAITKSLLDPGKFGPPGPPSSEFQERFGNAFMDDIRVKTPESEDVSLREKISAISAGSYWNLSARDDRADHRYDKPIELTYEGGGSVGSLGLQTTLRLQQIRQDDEPFTNRLVWGATFAAPPVALTKDLTGRIRVDGTTYLGKKNFAWGRGEASLYFKPSDQFGLGVAYVPGFEIGSSQYEVDRLLATDAAHGRIDLDLGATRFSLLLLYDLDRKRVFDHEYFFSQAAGCAEIYVLYRKVTGSLQIGVRLRAEEVLQKLRVRREKREKALDAKLAGG